MFLSVLLGVVGCYISYAQSGYIVSTASRQANTFVESPENSLSMTILNITVCATGHRE